ncbi:MAG TPA: hypothetical protein VF173_35790 [Thermoanaerobaculia bacterium]|nr:hypothetical protein [Thermoanaerobaculia bacterium]
MGVQTEGYRGTTAATTHQYGGIATGKGDLPLLLEPARLEEERFWLAKWLLLGLVVLFVLSAAADLFAGDQGKTVFEACKTIVPPIATLVIGYYFSNNSAVGGSGAQRRRRWARKT